MTKTIRSAILALTISFGILTVGCGNNNNNDAVFLGNIVQQGGVAILNQASTSSAAVLDNSNSVLFSVNVGNSGSSGSMSITQVRDGNNDVSRKLGEVIVGTDPQCVAVSPDNTRAYVTNGADNTVSVIDVASLQVVATINVGSEPRGCCLSPLGTTLYVANFSDGTMSVINTATNTVSSTVDLTIGAPFAICCTNDLDEAENDERIIVTDFWGRARPGLTVDQTETFNNGREGRVATVDSGTLNVTNVIALDPIASGFSADRTAFAGTVYAGGNAEPQEAFFNQLASCAIDPANPDRLYVVSIGASPEPPVRFNVNVQALVGVIDLSTNTFDAAASVNLNQLIAPETQPANPQGTLDRAFAADTTSVAIRNGIALFISRAGNYALRGEIQNGTITLNNSAAAPAVRIPTGNIPNAVAISADGTRAYVNNEVDGSITPINLDTNTALADIATTDLPPVGSQDHNSLIGKLVFFTGLGVPDDGLINTSVRAIDPVAFRNKASDNNWSSCASCHYAGTTDNVTWSFPTGPRNTPPLNSSFSKVSTDQRVFNWNAVRGSVTDFNNNSRNIQGGEGHAANPAVVFNHGPASGVSEALDLMTLWVREGVRTFNAPSDIDVAAAAAGRTLFAANCNSCHGTDLWTTSRVHWNRPLFPSNPLAPGGSTPFDPRVQQLGTGPVILAFDADGDTNFETPIIQMVGSFDAANPIEVRGGGGAIGGGSVGNAGSFNVPSLLGAAFQGPYGHHGRAQTLQDVFTPIANGGLGHATLGLTQAELNNVVEFVRSIDSSTELIP